MATKDEQYARAKEYLDYLKANSIAYGKYPSTFIPDNERKAKRSAAFAEAMSELGYEKKNLPEISKRFRDYSTVFAPNRYGVRPEKYAEDIVKQIDMERANAAKQAEVAAQARQVGGTAIPPYRETPKTEPVIPVSMKPMSERILPVFAGMTIEVPKGSSPAEAPTVAPTTVPTATVAAPAKQKYTTPYGVVEATPEQAQRLGAFERSAEGLEARAQVLRSQRLASGKTPIANIGGISEQDFQKQLQAGATPITREDLNARDAQIRQLEAQAKAQRATERANTYLDRIETLRRNRAGVMAEDRKKFAEGKDGDKAFAAKWNSPMYRSIIDQPSVVAPEYTGKRDPDELSDWFKAKQASFVPMTATLEPMTGIAERGMDRAIRQQDAAARQAARDRGFTGAAVPGMTSSQGRRAIIGANVAAASRAAQQAQEGAEQFRANSKLLEDFKKIAEKANENTNLIDDEEERKKLTKIF